MLIVVDFEDAEVSWSPQQKPLVRVSRDVTLRFKNTLPKTDRFQRFTISLPQQSPIMRAVISYLLLCLASFVAALSATGSRVLVVLEDAAEKGKYATFFADLAGEN